MYYEQTFSLSKNINIAVPIAVGGGHTYYDWRVLDPGGVTSFPYEEQFYLYVEPAARVEIKLNNRWRVVGGAAYTLALLAFDYRGVTQGSVTAPRFQPGVRFGKYWD